jgi:hypothetical protein
MFEPTPTTHFPPRNATIKSFTKLMHEISGDYTDPIHLEVTTPSPTHPDATTLLPI